MKKKLSPVEQFCRETILKVPNSYEMANLYRQSRVADDYEWPDWCDLPRGVINKIYNYDYRNVDDGIRLLRLSVNKKFVNELAAVLTWMRYKTIYRFDDELSMLLSKQSLDGDIPLQLLSLLPYPSMFVECETQLGDDISVGFYTWMEVAFDKGRRLQMLHLLDNGDTRYFNLILAGNLDAAMQLTHWEAIASTESMNNAISVLLNDDFEESRKPPPLDITVPELDPKEKANITSWLNHLLYLCSEKPDMLDMEILKKRRTYDSIGAPKRAATVDVGTRVGTALRKSKKMRSNESSSAAIRESGKTKSVIPHIRRAHWHRFWVGPRDGKRMIILRWIPPTAINIDNLDEFSPVIHDVKK